MFTFFILYDFMTYEEIWHRLAVVYPDGEAKAQARMLLEDKFGLSFADILCGGIEQLSADDTMWLARAVARIEQMEPIQYVLGEAWFCGNRFAVGEGVLIPRPETEWLVERACCVAREMNVASPRILDIGTGSGCIAVSLKKVLPNAYVEAWDISEAALAIAKENAKKQEADVVFKQRDALALTDIDTTDSTERQWDIIVSNPPYICDNERKDMDANVLEHEPATALFVPDDDPLLFYRSISRYGKEALCPNGHLLFECNTRYAVDTADMMRQLGYQKVVAVDDCFGKPRFAEGVLKL